MIEIRLHGRGGQGVKKASMILGRAGYLAKYKTQDFAMYGAERKGAPVSSFVRIKKTPITTRGHIFHPDYIIILDETLDLACNLTGSKPSTKILINSTKDYKNKNIQTINATKIAMDITGKNIPNAALLGAFAKISKLFTLKQIKEALKIELGKYNKKIIDKNLKAAEIAYNRIK
jgi:pyruvate ferredoxin oxidoreductase gamma subunit